MTDYASGNFITKYTQIIERNDGSEVKIVGTAYFGAGLHMSVGVDVFKRDNSEQNWNLCNDRPRLAWKEMSRDEYIKNGRSEMLQVVSIAEILKVSSMIGKPINELPLVDTEVDACNQVDRPRNN